MVKFEIGLVYKRNQRFYLAVSSDKLITRKNGKMVETKPSAQYDVVRSISVEVLSESWGLTLDQFDQTTKEHLSPLETVGKTRPRGTCRKTSSEDEYWRRSRTGRIASPRL